jgi:hypothetical protein
MRCNNCGWDNQNGATVCIKCNTRLEQTKMEAKQPPAENRFGKTISDHDIQEPGLPIFGETMSEDPAGPAVGEGIEKDILISCTNPDCGYLNPADALSCARCKSPLSSTIVIPQRQNSPLSKGTIDPYRNGSYTPACQLTLVLRDGEANSSPSGALAENSFTREFTLVNDSIELKRDNLDKDNNTITGKIQAELFFENGRWQLLNRSEMKTTFIQVSEKVELKDGDVILMGNRKFIFSTI